MNDVMRYKMVVSVSHDAIYILKFVLQSRSDSIGNKKAYRHSMCTYGNS